MRKIYSIIILMCSFCMAGFADEAKQLVGGLPSGRALEEKGASAVVIGTTNLRHSVAGRTTGSKLPVVAFYSSYLFTSSVGWILSNNLSTHSDNNSGASPDAGFSIHNIYDEHNGNTPAERFSTGSASSRFFAFVSPTGIVSIHTRLSSHIYSPFKTVIYG